MPLTNVLGVTLNYDVLGTAGPWIASSVVERIS